MDLPTKKLKQLKNNNTCHEEVLKNNFLESAPDYYNRKALDVLFNHTVNDHEDSDKKLFLSRLNDFKKKSDKLKEDWLSLFAEIHTRYMITEKIKGSGYKIKFTKKEENDLCISKNGKNISVEVKAIMPSDFQSDYNDFLKEIRAVPTGKAVSIKIKNDKSGRHAIFRKIKNKLVNLSGNYSDDEFEIMIIKNIQDKNKTAFIGPTITFWVNQDGLTKVMKKKLNDKPKQIGKADIICFYSFHNMFDSEDFCEVIRSVAKEISSIDNKKFLCFTSWNSGQLFAIIKKNNEWSIGSIEDCI
jgi:hypothetical protein